MLLRSLAAMAGEDGMEDDGDGRRDDNGDGSCEEGGERWNGLFLVGELLLPLEEVVGEGAGINRFGWVGGGWLWSRRVMGMAGDDVLLLAVLAAALALP